MQPSPNHLQSLLLKLQLHSFLSEEDRKAVLALPYTLKTLEPHSYTIREGDAPAACAVLVSGFAHRQKVTSDGLRQIVAIHIPGEPLDFQNLFLNVADHSVQMLTRSDVAFIPRAALQELARTRLGHWAGDPGDDPCGSLDLPGMGAQHRPPRLAGTCRSPPLRIRRQARGAGPGGRIWL